MVDDQDHLIQTFGRRRGRRLRPNQQALLQDLLPRLKIAETEGQLNPRELFGPGIRDYRLEVGFGGGEHLADQAAHHPEVGFIGCEPYLNGIVALLRKVKASKLPNVRVWPADARGLLPRLPDHCLSRVYVLFPDPWPKARHHKRRLISPPFLDALARVMMPGGELRVASDDPDYIVWILERLTGHPEFRWLARRPADWRRPPPDQIATRYGQWAQTEGRQSVYFSFVRR